ncbi:MAG TPA: cell division protein FtsH [Alphaproteobacteria bacterium]|nr:cell division protein FtsH [Alphaproteobacteria bacterium]
MNNFGKNILIWIVIIIAIGTVYDFMAQDERKATLAFSDFLASVEKGNVREVRIQDNNISGTYTDGTPFSTFTPNYPNLIDKLNAHNVRIDAEPRDQSGGFLMNLIASAFPILLLVGLWFLMMRQMGGGKNGAGGAFGFGRSKARMLSEKDGVIKFNDVAGIDEAKEEVQEIVDFLKDPHKFTALGGKIPKGVLLSGNPGTGKTLLARAIAGEAGVPFFTISGSDFVEMFVGVGASRVRDMFAEARKHAPCIVFIDEIDAVGRHRGAGTGGGNDEREQTLNQLLVEMDGFQPHEGIIIIAATNRPDVLDPALLRPGRFDRQVVVGLPDVQGREKILNIHLKKIPVAPDVDTSVIARGTPGFSGADLANLCNEAALIAARRDKKVVTMREMEYAKDKVMMGVERKSMVMDEEEKKLTAYHEAGHAIVGVYSEGCDPIHKATIIPRGRALGMVMRLPEKDRYSMTRQKMKADMAMAMGGRVAEELIFGYEKVTSGASSDIQYVSNLARSMVKKWGMSDVVGPVFHGDDNENPFLGYSLGKKDGVSEDTLNKIDDEVKILISEAHDRAKRILEENIDKLHMLAKSLLEHETLTGDEIKDVMDGKDVDKKFSSKADNGKRKKSSFEIGGNDNASGSQPIIPPSAAPQGA